MRRAELLIERIRSISKSTQYSTSAGVQQNDILEFINNAQDFLFSQIEQTKPKWFITEKIMSCVNGQEEYSLPANAFLKNIDTIEYSSSGNVQDYRALDKYYIKERSSSPAGYPCGYVPRGTQILLVPPAVSGSLRLNYSKKLNQVDVRRGKISAVTLSATQLTALTLDTSEASFNATEINKYNYICIVNRDGTQVMKNIQIDSISASTGVVTLTAAHTFESGETASTSCYVVAGKDKCNTPELPDICERLLVQYGVYGVKFINASEWSVASKADVGAISSDIIGSFATADDDINSVPITNTDYIDTEYYF